MQIFTKKIIPLAISLTLPILSSAYDLPEILDLGTSKTDNSGDSEATVISADGRVIARQTATDSGNNQAFRYNKDNQGMTGLGTLKIDNSGDSFSTAISADGRVVVGNSDTDSGGLQAFRHNEGDQRMTALGTLKADNSGESSAFAISADGRVVVGWAATNGGDSQAFRHNEGDQRMTGLGTLKSDNSGGSNANNISADGRVVVGWAATDGGNNQAYRYNEGDQRMTGLGTLKSDNSGWSYAAAASADGRVVIGRAVTDSGNNQAYRHNEGDQRMTGLGTLRADNSGYSTAIAVSADGRVVVGSADTDGGDRQAFRHNEGDQNMTGLGTLRVDNSGNSTARAVSADGRIVVGSAATDSGDAQAFRHREGDQRMTGLGTLKADNSGGSSAFAVSADGSVVIGRADTDNNEHHAVVWKYNKATSGFVTIDATNSNRTMTQSAKNAYKVLDLYRSRLIGLSQAECSLDNFSYCVGAFSNYDSLNSNSAWTTGLFGAVRLAPQWTMGLSVDYLLDSSLPNGYGTRGSSNPGVGAFMRFQQDADQTGFNVTVSAAYQEQKVDIRRQKLSNTEAGIGNSKIDGQLVNLDVAYGFKASDKVTLFPHTGIRYTKMTREAYSEHKDAELPASYGKLGEESTAITLGLGMDYSLSDKVSLNADAGVRINASENRNHFTGDIDYIGAHAYDFGAQRKTQPYVDFGIKTSVTKQSALSLRVGWAKQSYDHDTTRVGLSYSYRF